MAILVDGDTPRYRTSHCQHVHGAPTYRVQDRSSPSGSYMNTLEDSDVRGDVREYGLFPIGLHRRHRIVPAAGDVVAYARTDLR